MSRTSNSKNELTKYSTDFGASVSSVLAEARMTQPALATATGISTAYTNQIITGRKPVPEGWIDLVAEHLQLPPDKKQELLAKARKQPSFELPSYNNGKGGKNA